MLEVTALEIRKSDHFSFSEKEDQSSTEEVWITILDNITGEKLQLSVNLENAIFAHAFFTGAAKRAKLNKNFQNSLNVKTVLASKEETREAPPADSLTKEETDNLIKEIIAELPNMNIADAISILIQIAEETGEKLDENLLQQIFGKEALKEYFSNQPNTLLYPFQIPPEIPEFNLNSLPAYVSHIQTSV